jgi:Tfp pilus assembly protein PilF
MRTRKYIPILAALLSAWLANAPASADDDLGFQCAGLQLVREAFDYRNPEFRPLVNDMNKNHFNQNVQSLKRGQTNSYLMGDLDYMLRFTPNHLPALQTMSRYFLGGGKPHDWFPAECYFESAIRFVPDDSGVRMIYGVYLMKRGRTDEGSQQLEAALRIAPESAEVHYNLGLAYIDLKELDKAMYHAARAYDLGFPLPGLKNKLIRLQAWKEPSTVLGEAPH